MLRGIALAVAVCAVASCGPIAYIDRVTIRATSALDDARAAGAEQYSPYYWTRATQYLVMAREVAAHADYQGANRFGRLAEDAANRAKVEALAKRPVTKDAPL